MSRAILLDTGPLVAFVHRRDYYHSWAVEQFDRIDVPVLTCEPVLSEACFLLRTLPNGCETVLKLAESGLVNLGFSLEDNLASIKSLLHRYASVPMSLADACLVRMAENHSNSCVITIDSDFEVYRKHGRQAIPVIMPSQKR